MTIEGFLLIPHELLHIAACRLLGKEYTYRLGDTTVRLGGSYAGAERIFVLLFPLAIHLFLTALLVVVWFSSYVAARYPVQPHLYLQSAPWWHSALLVAWTAMMTYTGVCVGDLRSAWRLVKNTRQQQPQ